VSGAPITPLVSVYDGRECVGFILARGKLGFEAIDRDERSLGTYRHQREAADALCLHRELAGYCAPSFTASSAKR
jgi:hypothetical protein